ncbi:MAG: hypothetical protein H6765_09065 [Candidatus Peribacteria bacterium]|nr:MAG: hypothetical protein H6765_09065 [Candidatus Peribacteria bacterium]
MTQENPDTHSKESIALDPYNDGAITDPTPLTLEQGPIKVIITQLGFRLVDGAEQGDIDNISLVVLSE